MSVDQPRLRHPAARIHVPVLPRHGLAATVGFVAIAASGLLCAKWDPYGHKIAHLFTTRSWTGRSILDSAGSASAAPSWHGAWSFARSYGQAVWMALVAALVIAAAVEALVPRRRIVSLLTGRSTFAGTAVAGLLAVPCMMCTCCSAPIAATLRRRGVPTSSVLGYWIGNPILNPAVLVFLALVAPWQWVATRIVVGGLLVFAVIPSLARFTTREPATSNTAEMPDDDFALREAPMRFVKTLLRLAFTLVPEYFVVVLAIGAFRGWLFPLGANAARWGIVAVIVAAVAGTLVVIPTAGEIPILQGLSALGLGTGPLGALLITLPAVSLPSMAMVGRALSWRVTLAVAGIVMVTGLAGAILLAVLSFFT